MRAITIALLLLAACTGDSPGNEAGNAAANTDAPLNPSAPGQPGALPDDRSPVVEGPVDQRSPQGAGQVLQRYFALVESGRYDDAYALWSDGGRASGMSAAEFRESFGRYREYHANIGAPGRLEGAAGSLFVEVPVQVYGRLRDGREFSRSGTATLRRANEVPGSTAEQRQWRIYRIELERAADRGSTAYRFVGRWASEERNCGNLAWRFTAESLATPAGSRCVFRKVTEVPGGYDIAARCTAEGPPTNDVLKLRFAESARALLFESETIADAGLVRCTG